MLSRFMQGDNDLAFMVKVSGVSTSLDGDVKLLTTSQLL